MIFFSLNVLEKTKEIGVEFSSLIPFQKKKKFTPKLAKQKSY